MIFTHEFSGETFPFVYQTKNLNIYLKLDSHNVVYRTRFETSENDLKPTLDEISFHIQDKNLDDLLHSLATSLETHNRSYWYDLSLMHFKEALAQYSGLKDGLYGIEESKLVCRCAKIDEKRLKQIIKKEQAKKVEIKKSSNVTMLCGNCKEAFESQFQASSVELQVFEGKSYQQWEVEINNAFKEFEFVSPAEFLQSEIKLKRLTLPQIDIEIATSQESLTVEFAKRSLLNFLGKELNYPIFLDVVVGNSFSNQET